MNAYEILRNVHHIGSPIAGTVISREELDLSYGNSSGHLMLQTDSAYPALLRYDRLVDQQSSFSPDIIPKQGTRVDAVVFNFVDGKLCLSAKPSDLAEATIRQWQQYYDYIDSLTIGSTVTGVVERTRPFGVFVNIGGPFIGLIDIGHTHFNGGVQLPYKSTDWPNEGDEIRCNIAYFRLHSQQIGLGWMPGNAA